MKSKNLQPQLSNTGIVPTAVLNTFFPQYDAQMLSQFMIMFELCQAVDLSHILALDGSSCSDLGPLLFFPALVNVDRPSSATAPSNSFGWSLIVRFTNQFFTTHFFHVLLYQLPFMFTPPAAQTTPLLSVCNRSCELWSKGIKWLSETGVTTIVEMSETFQSLSLAMSSPDKTDPKYLELALCSCSH